MGLESFPVDLAAFFESEEVQRQVLNEALATGHAGTIAGALGLVARARGMSGLAAATGMKRQQLYRALGANGNPTLDTLARVMTALGYRMSAERARPDAGGAATVVIPAKAGISMASSVAPGEGRSQLARG
ncbi:addiction module antidote protein [Rhizorhabdus argentea]|uniref:addiction module antidote protein n=1 Tax=Rhizorhabdus argentea TaxID=1387174 RepID=UPI0030EBE046